jgi:hypothetical protein
MGMDMHDHAERASDAVRNGDSMEVSALEGRELKNSSPP